MGIKRGGIRVGCSGWSYNHWRGAFYPEEIPKSKWFSHYSSIFQTVEVNSTFYHLPREGTCKKWYEEAPAGFLYALKLWRAITHFQRLEDVEEPLKTFLSRISPLQDKLAVVLVQLPPSLHREHPLLEAFLKLLPKEPPFAFEFRHLSWYEEGTYKLLERYGAHLVIHDYRARRSPLTSIGGLTYARFHGPKGDYRGSYERENLRRFANYFLEQANAGAKVFGYFNNDYDANAPKNALTLLTLCGESK